jgi:hypothetical protein
MELENLVEEMVNTLDTEWSTNSPINRRGFLRLIQWTGGVGLLSSTNLFAACAEENLFGCESNNTCTGGHSCTESNVCTDYNSCTPTNTCSANNHCATNNICSTNTCTGVTNSCNTSDLCTINTCTRNTCQDNTCTTNDSCNFNTCHEHNIDCGWWDIS